MSGPVAVGKTALATALSERFGFRTLKTRELIAAAGVQVERESLQKAGDRLDRATNGEWVATALSRLVQGDDDQSVVVDSVRKKSQIDAIRAAYPRSVVHVHLAADRAILTSRYAARNGAVKELPSYDAVRKNLTERHVEKLGEHADINIWTDRTDKNGVVVRVAGRLGLYGSSADRLVDVIVGGQFGSEGKGNVAAYLAPEYQALVRVGGPNAGHTVYARPESEVYHHLPSGTRRCDLKILGPGAVLYIPRLLEEISAAGEHASVGRLLIDHQAMIIEDSDKILEERQLVSTIGSTGSGVGGATARKTLRNAMKPDVRLAKDLQQLEPYLADTIEVLETIMSSGGKILVEGTQGSALSLHHGLYPYVTSRDTTASGCIAEAGISPSRIRRVIMVCRTYPIRVQSPRDATSGAMGSAAEISWEIVAKRSGADADELRRTEKTTTTKRERRVSEFDWGMVRRAATLNGPTDIALTFADYIDKKNELARRFEQLTSETRQFIEELEWVTGAPVTLVTSRFHYRGIIDRRQWGRS